jgi:hypothetical protein
VVKVDKSNDDSIKTEEKFKRPSVDSVKALTTPIPAKTKKLGIWSKLPCLGTLESPAEIEIIEGKDASIVDAVKSPKLRLKGRVFMKDVTKVLAYKESGQCSSLVCKVSYLTKLQAQSAYE